MSAIELLSQPLSRDAQLAKARVIARRWVDAMPASQRGPLWDVLSDAVDFPEATGLNDNAFLTFVKNAKRYCDVLERHGIDQNTAFERRTIIAYHVYVSGRARSSRHAASTPAFPRSNRRASPGGKRAATSRA